MTRWQQNGNTFVGADGWAGWAGWEFAAVVGCTVQKDEQWETLIGKSDETRSGRSQESLPVG